MWVSCRLKVRSRASADTAPENPLPDSFAGVTNFVHIVDTMIATRPGFRYENCANGGTLLSILAACLQTSLTTHVRRVRLGHFKGLALARRFTFITTNDAATSKVAYRQTHWLNSHAINPLQLKCDVQVASSNLNYTLRTCLLGAWLLAMPPALDIAHNAAYKAHIGKSCTNTL